MASARFGDKSLKLGTMIIDKESDLMKDMAHKTRGGKGKAIYFKNSNVTDKTYFAEAGEFTQREL